jgi:hypothetical protein
MISYERAEGLLEKLELPLLLEHGYLKTPGLSANPQLLDTLVAKTGKIEGSVNHETRENQALGGIRTLDLRFTKPSLCQAELLGQNMRSF